MRWHVTDTESVRRTHLEPLPDVLVPQDVEVPKGFACLPQQVRHPAAESTAGRVRGPLHEQHDLRRGTDCAGCGVRWSVTLSPSIVRIPLGCRVTFCEDSSFFMRSLMLSAACGPLLSSETLAASSGAEAPTTRATSLPSCDRRCTAAHE